MDMKLQVGMYTVQSQQVSLLAEFCITTTSLTEADYFYNANNIEIQLEVMPTI